MKIICISWGNYESSTLIAQKLASKLDYKFISRSQTTHEAIRHGIPVDKLEMSVVKNRVISESILLQIERFKAFLNAYLCEHALNENIDNLYIFLPI